MNLLIVGRKSKTQMRNMFYWAGIISILICLPLRVSAQSYEQLWKQVEVLEHQTKMEPLFTDLAFLLGGRVGGIPHGLAVHPDAAGVRPFQKVQAAQQGGLAGAGRADDGQRFALLQGKRNVL